MFGPLLWVALVTASASDVRTRKVPNALNTLIALAGCGAQFALYGLPGLGQAALGVGVAFALVIVPFAIRLYRGGDAKLVMALGAWFGPADAAWVFLWGVALGGVLAVLTYFTLDRDTRRAIRANFDATARTASLPQVEERRSGRHVPMALAFSAGAVVTGAVTWP